MKNSIVALWWFCAPIVGLTPLFAGSALAQNNINWLTVQQDNSVLVSNSSVGVGDSSEKDYATGDLDRDGWIDMIVVRKQPFTSEGRRTNVLFMNESGSLVDRTSVYATGSDVPGDNGFSSATNDRDVVIVDVNNDGWLDVVTATTLSPGEPKSVSHPRVYMNLGESAGTWLGLYYEEARTPDWGTYPNMCGLGVGDVTGDGFPDLYFSHYEQEALVDLNDRLLINDGNGFFGDESFARMTAAMRGSSFGTSSVLHDMNGDGTVDVVSVSGSGSTGGLTRTSIAYNNMNNEGYFNVLHEPYQGAPYHVAVGDLNYDGLPDLIVSDDGDDRFLLNQGNDVFGRVSWSAAYTFGPSGDLGFASNNLVVDLNGDGWNEAIFCDVDVDIPGCSRRLQINHNRGGSVGGSVSLYEERSGSNYGANGLPAQTAVHDVAVFDVDNDGDEDLVIGRCFGTNVFLNQRDLIGTNYCGPAIVNSSASPARMSATGSPLASVNDLTIHAEGLPLNQFGYFLVSNAGGLIVTPGGSQGNLCLGGAIGRLNQGNQIRFSGTTGTIELVVDLSMIPTPGAPAAVQAGEVWYFTSWFRDNLFGFQTSNFSDGLEISFR
ncbi:MAG: VCBS repeat-containing protein [bacterium]|nr:VCBS repeat-containing protein [bacterium]